MSKRFVSTNKWKDAWYFTLSREAKQVIDYLRDNCDAAGVWDCNFHLAEFEIGFNKSPQRYRHPELTGIEYTLKSAAIEDVNGRGLETDKIIPIPNIVWKDVLAEINTPYEHEMQFGEDKDLKVQIEPMFGGRKWWLPKFIAFQYSTKDGQVKLSETTPIHVPVIRALRTHGLLARFKLMYPTAQIVELSKMTDDSQEQSSQEKPAPKKKAPFVQPPMPILQQILDADIAEDGKEVLELPVENRKEFFYHYAKKKWRGIDDWYAALVEWTLRWFRMEEERKQGRSWPETIRDKTTRIDEIDERMLILGKERFTPTGGTGSLIKPEAKAELQKLKGIKDQLQKEIREGEAQSVKEAKN